MKFSVHVAHVRHRKAHPCGPVGCDARAGCTQSKCQVCWTEGTQSYTFSAWMLLLTSPKSPRAEHVGGGCGQVYVYVNDVCVCVKVSTEFDNNAIRNNDDRILHCCLLYQDKVKGRCSSPLPHLPHDALSFHISLMMLSPSTSPS